MLRVKYNQLTKLPDVLAKMAKLEVLELSGNQLTVLDDKILADLNSIRCVAQTVCKTQAQLPDAGSLQKAIWLIGMYRPRYGQTSNHSNNFYLYAQGVRLVK